MPAEVKFSCPTKVLYFDGIQDGSVVSFDLATPRESRNTANRATVDGSEVVVMSYTDVQETITLMIEDTAANIEATIQTLEKMLQEARRAQYNLHLEGPVYIEYKSRAAGTWYRSEIVSGAIQLEMDVLNLYLDQGKVVFEVQLMRKWFWEKSSEEELSLSNPTGSGTGGRTIYNANDAYSAVRYNYVEITSSGVLGDVPAPLRLQIYNNFNDSDTMGDVWIGAQHVGTPSSLQHVIEGEDRVSGGTILPGTPDYAAYSDGQYVHMTWSGTSETLLAEWSLTSNMLAAFGGNYFYIFGILAGTQTYQDLRLRLKILVQADYLWEGEQEIAAAGVKLIDFGALRMPPYKSYGTPHSLRLRLYAQRDTTGDHSLDLDFFQFLPMNHWRHADVVGYFCAYQVTLYVDEINESIYTKGWSAEPTSELHNYVLRGNPIYVVPLPNPTEKQRIVFMMCEDTLPKFFNPTRTAVVRAYYRPRKISL